jgi:hypothetical protein
VQFSGKITNSIMSFLARSELDREWLFELTEIPFEFLRDPTSWIPAAQVERFLRLVESALHEQSPNLLREAGQKASELKAWGVLDSVLKMMPKPQDIFSQPHRFISYFISPAPPILNYRQNAEAVSFDLPIAHVEYPLTVAYLSAALEGLPRYGGREPAQVSWNQTTVRISWSEAQRPLLPEAVIKPGAELVDSLVRGVEMAEARSQAKDLEIASLERQIAELRARRSEAPQILDVGPLQSCQAAKIKDELVHLRDHVSHLHDYLTRCQQALIVARSAQQKDPQVQAVLRRIDWDQIRRQSPWLHLQISDTFQSLYGILGGGAEKLSKESGGESFSRIFAGLSARLNAEESSRVTIRSQSFVDEVPVADGPRVEILLWQVLSSLIRELRADGEIELLARQDGNDFEVAMTAKGEGNLPVREDLPLFQGATLTGEASLSLAAQRLSEMRGRLSIAALEEGGRRISCRWPIQPNQGAPYASH